MNIEVSHQNETDAVIRILEAAAYCYATEKIWNGSALNIAATLAKSPLEDLEAGPVLQVLKDTNFPTKEIGSSVDLGETG